MTMILTERTVVVDDFEYASDEHRKVIKALLDCEDYAIKYRAGESVNHDYFYPNYGICDNLGRGDYHHTDVNMFACVKDNVIRRLPSFSGAYHFPVRHPDFKDDSDRAVSKAEEAWDDADSKWEGVYGANRLIQLKELIQFCLTQWNETLTKDMTPAQRNGIEIGKTICQRREDNTLWVLSGDDGSSDPYFIPHGDTNNNRRRSIELRKLRVMRGIEVRVMSVKALISKMEKLDCKKTKLEAQIALLQSQVNQLQVEIVSHEVALIKQHRVRRV